MSTIMSKIIRYTNSGHRFEIEGNLEAGYTIIVTVIPAEGYEFVQWLTGLSNITEIEPDEEGNRRFSIHIDECGLSFSSLFQPAPTPPEPTPDTCDKAATYNILVHILYGSDVAYEMPWDSSEDISCDAIDSELDSILNGGTVVYHTITALANDSSFGTVSGSGQYVENLQAILTATANEGYEFRKWDDGVTTATRIVTVIKDETFIAIFESIQVQNYDITVLANNDNWGIVSGTGRYDAGDTIQITATPNDGYYFDSWDDGDVNNIRDVEVSEDKIYTALFKEIKIYSAIFSVKLDDDGILCFIDENNNKVEQNLIEQLNEFTFVFGDELYDSVVTYTDENGNEQIIDNAGDYDDYDENTHEIEIIIHVEFDEEQHIKLYKFEKV